MWGFFSSWVGRIKEHKGPQRGPGPPRPLTDFLSTEGAEVAGPSDLIMTRGGGREEGEEEEEPEDSDTDDVDHSGERVRCGGGGVIVAKSFFANAHLRSVCAYSHVGACPHLHV